MSVHIQVFVPAYNCEQFIERCLESVAVQDYHDFSVVMVDDASTDTTWLVMRKFADNAHGWELWPNSENLKMPHNLTKIRDAGEPDDVIFILDGDDFLPHEKVLSNLATYYEPGVWLTYGSYVRHPDPTLMPNPALPFPVAVVNKGDFREFSKRALIYNHPLTFRRWLFNKVTDAELHDDEGHWFTRCYDHVIMMPMLELAARHFVWVPEILYTYSEENPLSEAKALDLRAESDRIHTQVNARPKREAL